MSSNEMKNQPVETELKGNITFENRVIETIIGKAIGKVDGLLSVDGGLFSNLKNKIVKNHDVREGVNVEVGKKQVAVDLNIITEYDKDILKIVENMKSVISEQVNKMTHLQVVEVNVNVVDIKTKEEFQAESISMQERLSDVAEATSEFAADQTEKVKSAISNGSEKAKEVVSNSTDAVKGKLQAARVE